MRLVSYKDSSQGVQIDVSETEVSDHRSQKNAKH